MPERLILPPNYPKEVSGPLIFLAGPIQDSPDWQNQAIQTISSLNSEVYISSPRAPQRIKYNEQVDWETFFLNRASENGVILFWLARPLPIDQRQDITRAYGQTSRFELGKWSERHLTQGTKLVLGIEDGFGNERYLKRIFSQEHPDIRIHESLEQTCLDAVSQTHRSISEA